jgi:hypothetical protein
MKLALAAAGLVILGFLLDRLMLWMECRGWIDYRQTYPGRFNSGQAGPAFLAIQGLLEPEKRHAAKEQTGTPDSTRDSLMKNGILRAAALGITAEGAARPSAARSLDRHRQRVVMKGNQRP